MTEHPVAENRLIDDEPDPEFAGFVRSIGIGAAVGIPLFAALVTLAVHLVAPDWPIGAVFGIAFWTGVWAGLFLGGTVTVGAWSHRQHEARQQHV